MKHLNTIVATAVLCSASAVWGQAMGQRETQQQQQQQNYQQGSMTQSQERQQAQRSVQVRESVIYGLTDEPRDNLFKAALILAHDPYEAAQCVKVAANHLELFAAANVSEGSSSGASSGSGSGSGSGSVTGSSSSRGGQDLRQAARQLELVSDRIRNHELTDMKEARREFGKALFALSAAQQKWAEDGLTKGNEKQVGYTLKSAANNLAAACTFAEVKSDRTVAQAIYNAEASGMQIVALNTPTTYQNNGQMPMTTPEGVTNAQPAGIFERAQTAGERQTPDQAAPGVGINREGVRVTPGQSGAQQSTPSGTSSGDRFASIATSARQSISELGRAIDSLRGQMQQGQQQNRGE